MKQIIRVTFPIAVGFVFEGMLDVGMEQITGWSAIAAYFAVGFVALFGFVKLRVYKWAEKEQEGEEVEDEADEDREGHEEARVSNFQRASESELARGIAATSRTPTAPARAP